MDTTINNVVIHGVQTHELESVWPYVAPMLADALKHDRLQTIGLDQVYFEIKAQSMQLWVVVTPTFEIKAAVVTQINNYPKQKILTVVLCAGHDMSEWLGTLIQLLKDFGTYHQCNSLMAYGRKGWAKALKQFGWHEVFTTVGMEL